MAETASSNGNAERRGVVATPGFLGAALFHYVRFLLNGHRLLREVAAALEATPDERVLDLGCGTGGMCLAVPGAYVGIDTDADRITFARWRWGAPHRRFESVELAGLDGGAGFDKAMLINCLHHLSDDEAAGVLTHLAHLVRRRLVVADLDPESANYLQGVLIRHDRGHFIRPVEAQRTLLARYFEVVKERRFPNTPRTAVQVLFVCEARR